MTTLDELLAYLPTNSSGAIDASDLRAVVTALWSEGSRVEARVTALELEESGGATLNLDGVWQVNANPGANPGGMQVSQDTGVLDTASWLRFDRTDDHNTDFTNALLTCQWLYVQNQMDSSRWVRYTVDSATDAGAYIQVNVTVGDSAGTPGSAGWQRAIVIMGGIPA